MTTEPEVMATLAALLRASGYEVSQDVNVEDATFDIVAEDNTRLIFFELKLANTALLDDFYDRQAALETALTELPLGKKWRDVYYVQLVTDPIDTEYELKAAAEIEGNIRAVRKLIIEIQRGDVSIEHELQLALGPLLKSIATPPPRSDRDVLAALAKSLVEQGFEQATVAKLVDHFEEPDHSCVAILEEELE